MQKCHPGEPVRLIQYGFYPLLFLAMLGYAAFELGKPTGQFGSHYGYYLLSLVTVMLLVEWLHPLRDEWKMTRSSFLRRDLPYLVIGGFTIGLVNYTGGWAILHFGLVRGSELANLSLLPSVILAILIPDFIWYWVHRWSHEGQGVLGRWMWTMHLAHHLPQQVYLLMHGVAHPINTVIVRIILTLPLYILGFSVESLFIANLVVGLQGFVSHFNVDIRAGWLNYLLVGTELHRYHHSADPREGKNYAAVVSTWDLLFGTFDYQSGRNPQRLGVTDPTNYPRDEDLLRVMALPFREVRRTDSQQVVGLALNPNGRKRRYGGRTGRQAENQDRA